MPAFPLATIVLMKCLLFYQDEFGGAKYMPEKYLLPWSVFMQSLWYHMGLCVSYFSDCLNMLIEFAFSRALYSPGHLGVVFSLGLGQSEGFVNL